ncbi:hypothetical protein HOY80DRAFT_996595 [Tuber brumale]|nr:hypothetical protein HOY80DRAFT_996595 [Tuber brumale]
MLPWCPPLFLAGLLFLLLWLGLHPPFHSLAHFICPWPMDDHREREDRFPSLPPPLLLSTSFITYFASAIDSAISCLAQFIICPIASRWYVSHHEAYHISASTDYFLGIQADLQDEWILKIRIIRSALYNFPMMRTGSGKMGRQPASAGQDGTVHTNTISYNTPSNPGKASMVATVTLEAVFSDLYDSPGISCSHFTTTRKTKVVSTPRDASDSIDKTNHPLE